jgi:PAS domain-containing protein
MSGQTEPLVTAEAKMSPAPPRLDFRALFDAVPDLYLVVLPDDPAFTIVFANQAYTQATLTNAAEIAGRPLFEVFPDNPHDPQAAGVQNVLASLRQVIATKASHTIPRPGRRVRRALLEPGELPAVWPRRRDSIHHPQG